MMQLWGRAALRIRLTRAADSFGAMPCRVTTMPSGGQQFSKEEFPGYFALDDFDLAALEPRSAALPVLLGLEVGRTQVVKQADVVLLCHLLQHEFDPHLLPEWRVLASIGIASVSPPAT